MGRGKFSQATYDSSVRTHTTGRGPVTAKAEEEYQETGKLNPLVDPAEYGVVRPSRPRFEQLPNGLFQLTIGTPVPVELRVDTTSSMGNHVDVLLGQAAIANELISGMLPGGDLQMANGIFNDLFDRPILCRSQFEALAERIVPQFTYMKPVRRGQNYAGGAPYGLFGAAYLTAFYINRIGLKSYDFTITDTEAHEQLNLGILESIFGTQVIAKANKNGFTIDQFDLPTPREVVQDLLKRSHAFLIHIKGRRHSISYWSRVYGSERVIELADTHYLPHTEAAIIGLTEGTLSLMDLDDFFKLYEVPDHVARPLAASLMNIPLGAQAALPNFGKRPQAGALFRNKTDLWPMTPEEIVAYEQEHGGGAAQTDEGSADADIDWQF